MIERLYIGSASGHIFLDGMWWMPGSMTPKEMRFLVEQLDASRNRIKAWTLNPLAIRCVVERWNSRMLSEEIYKNIFLVRERRPGEHALLMTPLHEAKSPTWLNHFAIEDLFMSDEFAPWIESPEVRP